MRQMMEFDVFDMASFADYRRDADKELDALADEVDKCDEWIQREFGDNPAEWQEEAVEEAEREWRELVNSHLRVKFHVQVLDCIERAMTCVNISAQMLDAANQIRDNELLENDDSVRREVAWAMSVLENMLALNSTGNCPWK